MLLYPRARIITLVLVPPLVGLVELPALIVLGLWIVMQVAFGAAGLSESGGGVAYYAHIGGFLAGLVLVKVLAREIKQTPPRLRTW